MVAALIAAVIAPGVASAQPVAHATRVGPAPATANLDLVLPLRADLAGLRRTALAVSTPGSSQYGAYRPVRELARRFGASAGARSRVLAYLRHAGAGHARIDVTGLFADASMTAGLAERLFGTPLAQFRADHGVRYIAPELGDRCRGLGIRAAAAGAEGTRDRRDRPRYAATCWRRSPIPRSPRTADAPPTSPHRRPRRSRAPELPVAARTGRPRAGSRRTRS